MVPKLLAFANSTTNQETALICTPPTTTRRPQSAPLLYQLS